MNKKIGDLTCGQVLSIAIAVLVVVGICIGVATCAIAQEKRARTCQIYGFAPNGCPSWIR